MEAKHIGIFRRVLGDDVGALIEAMVGVPLAIAAFMLATMLPMYCIQRLEKPSDEARILAQLPASSRELVKELADVQTKTQSLLSKLESDAKAAEALVEEKRLALADLQKKIDLLQLTPDQRRIVENYNRSVSPDVGFLDWVSRRVTWFELISSVVIGWFFYWLGRRSGRKQERPGTASSRERSSLEAARTTKP